MSKVDQAISIIEALGFPKAQQNERSGLTLLALVQLRKRGSWQKLEEPLLGVRAILDFCRNEYKKPYAENSRESFRKETLHQFVTGGLAVQNPDDPSRAPNSPKWCYQISPEGKKLLENYATSKWEFALRDYLDQVETLSARYKKARDFQLVPCYLPDGALIEMSPGAHSIMIKKIIEGFAPRFAPAAIVLYVGDTGNKGVVHQREHLNQLGIDIHERGKIPDVILYSEELRWLFLIESVTSVGPVDGKRHDELKMLFKNSTVGLVFVTAFPNRRMMSKFISTIAWETEVWVADNPDHLIHFNGDRFLGPH